MALTNGNGHATDMPEADPPAFESVPLDDQALDDIVRTLAPRIIDEDHLNDILDQVKGGPRMVEAVRRKLIPHLTFPLMPTEKADA